MPKFTVCETLNTLINLWLVFAGDNETWREVVKHRSTCETCLENSQWIIEHILEAKHGDSGPKPQSAAMDINAVFAEISETWQRTIAPMIA